MFNSLSSNLSIQFKLGGSHHTVAAACASGAVAIGEAFRRIRYGEDAVVLAGGADAPSVAVFWPAGHSCACFRSIPSQRKPVGPLTKIAMAW